MLKISIKFKSVYICWSKYNISASSHCLKMWKCKWWNHDSYMYYCYVLLSTVFNLLNMWKPRNQILCKIPQNYIYMGKKTRKLNLQYWKVEFNAEVLCLLSRNNSNHYLTTRHVLFERWITLYPLHISLSAYCYPANSAVCFVNTYSICWIAIYLALVVQRLD